MGMDSPNAFSLLFISVVSLYKKCAAPPLTASHSVCDEDDNDEAECMRDSASASSSAWRLRIFFFWNSMRMGRPRTLEPLRLL